MDPCSDGVRRRACGSGSGELCEYFEQFQKEGVGALLPPGVYTLEELKAAIPT
jgi:hypothetical protein